MNGYDDPKIEEFVNKAALLSVNASPTVLYHYCTHKTLRSIYESKTLWTTHILDMRNDRSEFCHGMELFIKELDTLVSKGLDQTLRDTFVDFIRREAKDPSLAPYVFCLTSNKDQDKQWKVYGDNGRGFALGFNASYFVEPRNVLYYSHEKQRVVSDAGNMFIELIMNLISIGIDVNNVSYVRALVLAFFRVAYLQSIRFKEEQWRDESEWRGVSLLKKNDTDLFTTKSSWCKKIRRAKIQYLETPPEIIFGPNCILSEADLKVVFPGVIFTRIDKTKD